MLTPTSQPSKILATFFAVLTLGATTLALSADTPPRQQELLTEWQDDIQPMLEHYCYDCHGDGRSKGKLDLERYPDLASMRKNPKVWEHILTRVDHHLMPPPRKEQPEREEREQLVRWINHAVFPSDINDPGHSVPRRMNRIEYQNTIKELLGIQINLTNILPPDDSGYGFDTNAHALSISPAHIEKYLLAAEKSLDQAIHLGPLQPQKLHYKGKDFRDHGHQRNGGVFLSTVGTTNLRPSIDRAGKYRLTVTASATQGGNEHPRLHISVNDKLLSKFEIKDHINDKKEYTTELNLPRGRAKISLTFPNDYYNPESKDPKFRDRNLMIHSACLEGPLGVKRVKPESHTRIYHPQKSGETDKAYTRELLTRFARRAFRRPVLNEEITRYLTLSTQLSKQSSSRNAGIKATLSAMLVSPSFLFISPDLVQPRNEEKISRIDEHTLASRLSYFLWSSMPDETLLSLADNGQLRKKLNSQITRMLKDPRAHEMVLHFTGQWLQLRDLKSTTRDKKRFSNFSASLAQDMRQETTLLAQHILLNNQSLLDFLAADYTFINESLAKHYGIPGIKGSHFRRITTTKQKRRGMLTHASILTLTSQPERTSPVLRGKFILENILDITPPPPPPDLPDLEEVHENGTKMTVREQLAMHREKSACAGCHNLMDPIGLAFENYDAIGVWRDSENGQPINASGKLVTGEPLDGAESLRLIILNNKADQFLRSLSVKLMTYALSRGITRRDRAHIEKILSELKANKNSAHSLIRGIVHSVPFQYQHN